MHNGNTTTTIARGCEWCKTCLYDGWGETTDEEARELGNAVVDLFHATCTAMGRRDIYWQPATSEVQAFAACDPDAPSRCFAGADGGSPRLDLNAIRVASSEAIMDNMEPILAGEDADLAWIGDVSRFEDETDEDIEDDDDMDDNA